MDGIDGGGPMGVVRGALREFGDLLQLMLGGTDWAAEEPPRGRPARGAAWIVIQIGALALTIALLFAIGGLFIDAPDAPETATSAAWVLPGFILALPLAVHWFARPARRVAGLLAGVAAGVVAGVAFAPVVAGWPALWPGLATLTVAGVAAGAVFGALAPVPGTPR